MEEQRLIYRKHYNDNAALHLVETFNSNGLIIERINKKNGKQFKFNYNNSNNLTEIIELSHEQIEKVVFKRIYLDDGKLFSEVDYEKKTTISYDFFKGYVFFVETQIFKVENLLKTKTVKNLDDRKRIIFEEKYTFNKDNEEFLLDKIIYYWYDFNDRIILKREYDTLDFITRPGVVEVFIRPDFRETRYSYDDINMVHVEYYSESDSLATLKYESKFDINGRLLYRSGGNSPTEIYTYDKNGKLLKIDSKHYERWGTHPEQQSTSNKGSCNYQYDTLDRVSQKIEDLGNGVIEITEFLYYTNLSF